MLLRVSGAQQAARPGMGQLLAVHERGAWVSAQGAPQLRRECCIGQPRAPDGEIMGAPDATLLSCTHLPRLRQEPADPYLRWTPQPIKRRVRKEEPV